MKRITIGQLIFAAAYTFFCGAAIFFLVRSLGAIVGLILGSNSVIAAALSQLADANISIPVWILFCGAAAVCVFRDLVKRTGRNTVIVTVVSILILLLAFAAAFLVTRVNGVFMHNTIGIIKMLLDSGLL